MSLRWIVPRNSWKILKHFVMMLEWLDDKKMLVLFLVSFAFLGPIEIIWADFGPRKLNGIYGLSSSGFSYHSGFLFQHFLAFSIISSHKFKSHEKLFQIGFGFPLISQQSPTNPKEQKERFGVLTDLCPFLTIVSTTVE